MPDFARRRWPSVLVGSPSCRWPQSALRT